MKSLRQLSDELTNLRLTAQNVSLWSAQVLLSERARRAINDGISIYAGRIEEVYTSLGLSNIPQVIALPPGVDHITRIEAVSQTGGGRRNITRWDQVKTGHTNLLYLNEVAYIFSSNPNVLLIRVDLFYETQPRELPPNLALMAATAGIVDVALSTAAGVRTGISITTGGAVIVTGGSPASLWNSPGFFELSIPWSASIDVTGRAYGSTDVREVVGYDYALPTGFTGITRAVEGIPIGWTQGALVSPVLTAGERMLPVIEAQAQAVMYEFWARNRAQYDQFLSLAQETALDMKELLALSRSFEDKADRRFKRVKQPPKPTKVRVRVRR